METTTATYRIPDDNLDMLTSKIAKLNKRAAKLKVEPITMTTLGSEVIEHADGTATRFYSIEITGAAPVLEGGWRFRATLEHLADEENIIRSMPGAKEVPTRFRTAAAECEHCQMAIRRKKTYILGADDERVIQVGSTCIKDFAGHADPHWLADVAQMMIDLNDLAEGSGRSGSGGGRLTSTETFLVHTAAVIRVHGWMSGGLAFELNKFSTKERADRNLYPDKDSRKAGLVVEVTDADKTRAEAALAWAAANLHDADRDSLNDYLYNLRVVSAMEYVEPKHFGILASLITTAEREGEKAERIERIKNERAASVHVGEVGKRQDFTLTCRSVREFDGHYGLVTIFNFTDADGNAVTWFCNTIADIEIGQTYTIKATVKAHETDETWGPQTIITRAKVAAIQAAA